MASQFGAVDISPVLQAFGQLQQANSLKAEREMRAEQVEAQRKLNRITSQGQLLGAALGAAAGTAAGIGPLAGASLGASLGGTAGRAAGGQQPNTGELINTGLQVASLAQNQQAADTKAGKEEALLQRDLNQSKALLDIGVKNLQKGMAIEQTAGGQPTEKGLDLVSQGEALSSLNLDDLQGLSVNEKTTILRGLAPSGFIDSKDLPKKKFFQGLTPEGKTKIFRDQESAATALEQGEVVDALPLGTQRAKKPGERSRIFNEEDTEKRAGKLRAAQAPEGLGAITKKEDSIFDIRKSQAIVIEGDIDAGVFEDNPSEQRRALRSLKAKAPESADSFFEDANDNIKKFNTNLELDQKGNKRRDEQPEPLLDKKDPADWAKIRADIKKDTSIKPRFKAFMVGFINSKIVELSEAQGNQ